jgi:hypothetical protein
MSINPLARRSQMAPVGRPVRGYVGPVDRPSGASVAFDPAAQGQFDLDSPPSPWLDLGWIENFQRTAATKYASLRSGPSGTITVQYRSQPESHVDFDLPSWGKLQMALAGGSQQMNVLAALPLSPPQGSGGAAIPPSPLQPGSTVSELILTTDQLANYNVGDVVAVDSDYTGAVGYIGAGAPAAYLSSPLNPTTQSDFIRRVTFNVSRVSSKSSTSLLLAQPLIGPPAAGMGVQRVVAFVDREGSTFFQEWSGLFVIVGETGGRACFYYPRLQVAASGTETRRDLAPPLFSHMLHASLHALPTVDANDGEIVLCYRSYFPTADAALF